jgi:hypothetical protein
MYYSTIRIINTLKIKNHVHLNHLKEILYGFINSAIFVDIETFNHAFTFTQMGNFQSGCLNYVSHCESMYLESNLKILFIF